jgi:hypothetical protein
MKDLIKQILREVNGMAIFHDGDREYAKDVDVINNLEFQRLESRGLNAYVIFKDKRFITTFEKVNNKSQLKKHKDNEGRIDIFYLTDEQAGKCKKIIDKTNEIIELKYNSIDLMSKHAIAAINEYYKKTNERNTGDN